MVAGPSGLVTHELVESVALRHLDETALAATLWNGQRDAEPSALREPLEHGHLVVGKLADPDHSWDLRRWIAIDLAQCGGDELAALEVLHQIRHI